MQKIDEYLGKIPEWQKNNLELFRLVIHEVAPSVTEDWKWNVPVFLVNNTVYFAMAAFKEHTKFNFIYNGALIKDSNSLFNNGFDSKKSRGIDLREHQSIDRDDLKLLIATSIDN